MPNISCTREQSGLTSLSISLTTLLIAASEASLLLETGFFIVEVEALLRIGCSILRSLGLSKPMVLIFIGKLFIA